MKITRNFFEKQDFKYGQKNGIAIAIAKIDDLRSENKVAAKHAKKRMLAFLLSNTMNKSGTIIAKPMDA